MERELPEPTEVTSGFDPKVGTKTSLPEPKSAVGLFILLWYAMGKPAALDCGAEAGKSMYDSEIKSHIVDYLRSQNVLPNEDLKPKLERNPLMTAQIESLNAAFAQYWRLGQMRFVDRSKNITAERTGGLRFAKHIEYSANMDILDVLIDMDISGYLQVLLNWITGNVECSTQLEYNLVKMLTVFSETVFCDAHVRDNRLIYNPSGVYRRLLDNGDHGVTLSAVEMTGATRILASTIKDDLNAYLRNSSNAIVLRSDEENAIVPYTQRAVTSTIISSIDLSKIAAPKKGGNPSMEHNGDRLELPRNLIYFGAPGTGKSYTMREDAKSHFKEENISRITFYPDYTYNQFVGGFRPFGKGKEIGYRFVPGPFLNAYVRARKTGEPVLLLIEEINRANPAAVFGDIFQLLDREEDGRSAFSVAIPQEMREYLAEEFKDNPEIGEYFEVGGESGGKDIAVSISLPANLYIWATMNSADQGVFPMDTAFKRRWDFRYFGVDENQGEIANIVIQLGSQKRSIRWNSLRKAINALLLKAHINEDKLLGPFFLPMKELETPESFKRVFKDKVLMYLYEDAAKMRRSQIFQNGDTSTYAEICNRFDKRGLAVFNGLDYQGEDDIEENEFASDIPLDKQ